MFIKDTSVVCMQVFMTIWERLWNIIYILKNNKDPNIDPWGTPQLMVPAYENTLSNEITVGVCEIRMKLFNSFIWKTYVIHFVL